MPNHSQPATQVTKFAEGDSRILMQKLARDRMKRHAREADAPPAPGEEEEARRCDELAARLAATASDKRAQQEAWDEHWELVYGIAHAVMDRVIVQELTAEAGGVEAPSAAYA